jgi:hypothetical protein
MPKRKTDPLADRDSYSIDQFCARNAIHAACLQARQGRPSTQVLLGWHSALNIEGKRRSLAQ